MKTDSLLLKLSFATLLLTQSLPSYAMKKAIIHDEMGQVIVTKHRPEEPADNADSDYDSGATMDLPLYQGTGCPQGSISSTLSPDMKTLSVIFDQFSTEAGTASGLTENRKNCRLRIPVHVSRGFQVAVVKSDVRGFVELPNQSSVQVRTLHNMAIRGVGGLEKDLAKRAIIRDVEFVGPMSDEIYIGNHVEQDQIWSPCGTDFNLVLGTQVQIRTNPQNEDSLAVIDSIDVQSQEKKSVTLSFKWRRCKPGANPGGGSSSPGGGPKPKIIFEK